MRSSAHKSPNPDEIAPSSSRALSIRRRLDQFGSKCLEPFSRKGRKTGLLKAALSTRPGSATTTKLPEDAIPGGRARKSTPGCPQASLLLWDRAYDALKEKDRLLVEEYEALLSRELPATNAEYTSESSTYTDTACRDGQYSVHDFNPAARQVQMMAIAEGALARLDAKAIQYRIFGRTYVLKDQITEAVKVVEQLKGIIGEAVKVSPQASVAWAGICVVIPLLANPSAQDTANRDGFTYVANRMGYYTALEPLLSRLLHDSSGAKTANDNLAARCNDNIEHLYQHILEFQLRSIRHYHRHWLCGLARDTIAYDGWKQTQLKVQELEKAVSSDLSQINALSSRQELESLSKTADDSFQVLRQVLLTNKDHLRTTGEVRDLLSEKQQIEKEHQAQKCHQTFRLTRGGTEDDSYEWYKGRVEDRVEGTCEWFLKHENFQSWLKRDTGPLLVSADPGCGKSVLAKYLIDRVLPSRGEANTCYFFFKDQDQNTLSQALCALLHQLFSQQPALICHAMPGFAENGFKIVTNTKLLWDILEAATEDSAAKPTTFVLDALDECVETDFRELMRQLTAFFVGKSVASRRVKFLLTGRPYSTVLSGFRELVDAFPYIRIPGEDENHSDAISNEVDHVIRHRVRKLDLSKHIEGYLEQRLVNVVHRTYLWVYLVFDYLQAEGFQKTKMGVDLVLQNIPTTVNHAYEKILARHKDSPIAQRIFSIILAASRPLTMAEMNVAVIINLSSGSRDDPELESEDDFRETLRRVCGLFVSIYHDRVYFLHQTAREFLLATPPSSGHAVPPWKHSITMRQAHTVLAEICVFYLDYLMPHSSLEELHRISQVNDGENDKNDDEYPPLLGYSALYWGMHFREAAVEEDFVIIPSALRICDETSKCCPAWFYLYRRHLDHTLPGGMSGLAIASHFGHETLAALLLAKGADVNAVDSNDFTALHMATLQGDKAVAELLIMKGADVDTAGSSYWTPLQLAVMHGDKAMIDLLMTNGACVNKGGHAQTPLHLAAKEGHKSIVDLLITNGADIEGDDFGETPLQYAVGEGHKDIVDLLVANGANVDPTDRGWSLTPLQCAAKGGHEAIVDFLVAKGADIDRTISHAHLNIQTKGYKAIVDLLLATRANVDIRNYDWNLTPLQHAAKGGYKAIVNLLIRNGADIERGGLGDPPLQLAVKGGHKAIVDLLVANGAKVDTKGRVIDLRQG
ncbi:uncharacterized protein C8A04DRAFT_28380 [Dichotomopilus funicola]|uniref:NACHT domain-containing protein n=1 Tax=Dichotomopilus funicola TaxID=1934379 RepID=A0AAN6ZML6_9PEZI|nr:hypothetical protein C8A04DRAFT_28380 [Dichotomopilus funicola]